jgi:predicted short-subunit dehydrogenase-like oxidoreductase (DUF2520 family)
VSARPLAVAIVGAGGLARAMARALGRSGGAEVTVASRRPAQARALARGARGVRSVRRIEDAIADAVVVVLAVPDRVIEPLARSLAPMRASWRGVVALHAAGAYGPELLAPLKVHGAATGVLHPLAVLGAGADVSLAGAYARLEGQPAALAAARRLCALTGLLPLRGLRLGSPKGRRSYHAAASLLSNDLIALLAAAQGLLVRRGVARRDALVALTTLAERALAQARETGLLGALTGPVARNDGATLLAQLRTLRSEDPAVAAAHRALSLRLLPLAVSAGRADRATASALRRLLTRGPRRSRTV